MAAKTRFVTLHNNANLCQLAWKRRSRYGFFPHQKWLNWYLSNYKKKREKNLYPFKQEARKTKCWVQVDTPLMLLLLLYCHSPHRTVGILLCAFSLATTIPPSVHFLMLSIQLVFPTSWPGLPFYFSFYSHLMHLSVNIRRNPYCIFDWRLAAIRLQLFKMRPKY